MDTKILQKMTETHDQKLDSQNDFTNMLFDAHTHLHEQINLGQTFLLCGYSYESNEQVIEQAKKYERAYISLGLAPQQIQREDLYPNVFEQIEKVKAQIESQKNNSRLVAIGEVGLDGHWAKTIQHKQRQFEAFEQMIRLCKKMDLAIVIHSRKALQECMSTLFASECKRVMLHCFDGDLKQAKIAVDAGWFVSIPPIRSKNRKKVIQNLGIENLLVESDAPYIAKKSIDAIESVKMIAEYNKLSQNEVLDKTYQNACKLFKIKQND